jgi:hypothetical protein
MLNIKQKIAAIKEVINPRAHIVNIKEQNKSTILELDNGTRRYPMNYNLRISLSN